ncbi:MAG TPA: carbon-nitrogen hydrolase family protein [Acidimicrobiales bacterium]|nr:carbon-nitrogen hydrolase family protein [Acidimicrobiales bacterium]
MTDQTPTETTRLALHALRIGPWLPTADALEAQADLIVEATARSAAGGARIAIFPENAMASPHKRHVSRSAPEIDEADWTKVDWHALRAQLTRVADAARDNHISVIVGAIHDLGKGRRPHNCLYVISHTGELETRYDKRFLSTTEITYMYTPGTEPVLVQLAGLRIGLVIGLEALFPDFFTAYADDGADLVVAASHGGGIFEQLIRSYAVVNVMPVALVIPPLPSDASRTGVYGVDGSIAAAGDSSDETIVFADIPTRRANETFHYKARHGFYEDRLLPTEPRSLIRDRF